MSLNNNKSSDINARSSNLPPNVVQGSRIVTREQLIRERLQAQERERQRQIALERQKKLEAEAKARAEAARRHARASARRRAEKEAAAAAAEAKEQKKAQRKAETQEDFALYRQAKADAAAQGIDLTSLTIRRTRSDTTVGEAKKKGVDVSGLGDLPDDYKVTLSETKVSGAKGVISQAAKNKAQKAAETQATFQAFRDLKSKYNAEGKDISSATFRITGGKQGNSYSPRKISVSGVNLVQPRIIEKKNAKITADYFGSVQAEKTRQRQIDDTLGFVAPEYRKDLKNLLSTEESKLDNSNMIFDEASLRSFAKDFEFYQDVKTGKGAADDVIYTPKAGILGRAGVYEGIDTFGFVRTMQIKTTKSKTTIEQPLSRSEQVELQIPKDDLFEGLKNNYKNIVDTFTTTGYVFSRTPEAFLGQYFGGNPSQASYDIEKAVSDLQKSPPDISSEFIGEVAIKSFINGNPRQNYNEFTQTLSKRPLYFTGSAIAEASLWVNPFTLPVKLAGLAGKAPVLLSKVGRAGSLLKFGKTNTFDVIQAARPETSINRYWIDFSKKSDLVTLARSFDIESPVKIGKIKPETFGTDLVNVAKEFERSPIKQFRITEERRPTIFGQKQALTIEEELGLVKLNPSKPRRTALKPSDVIKSDLFSGKEVKTSGAPFKFEDQSKLPKLGDIMKGNLWTGQASKSTGAPFKFDSRRLPNLSDILRSDVAGLNVTEKQARLGAAARAERSVFSTVTPSGKKIKKLSDILRSDIAGLGISEKEARLGEAGRAEGSVFANLTPSGKKVKKLADILKPNLFKSKKPKSGGLLSEKQLADLFETLEGKKEIGTARDLLSRKEQGRLAGDFLDDLKPDKAAKDAEKIADDLLKSSKKARRKKDDDLGAIEKAITGSGSTGQSSVLITKSRAASSSGEFPSIDLNLPTPKGYKAPAMKGFNLSTLSIAKSLTGKKESTKSIESLLITPKIGSIFGSSVSKTKTDLAPLLGLSILPTTRQSQRQNIRLDTRLRSFTGVGINFGFKFGIKQTPSSVTRRTGQTVRQNFNFTGGRSVTRLDTNIIRIPTPRKIPIPKIPFGKTTRSKGRKGKGRSQKRTFLVPDLPSALLGTKNPFARAFKKRFDKLY